jgi:hypothetical protein
MEFALLLKHTEFDDETTRLLTMAFNEVWEIIQAAGGPLVANDRAAVTRILLGQHLIDRARQGERDLDRLIDGALARLTES